ncbi:MAG TPA: molybdopterin-dependent oxidoreductase, partial [Aggregatilineaceae bacterium]|nr:molybdopterin-dependent oxidoreductase [Aggregatilineaceae bacterium]
AGLPQGYTIFFAFVRDHLPGGLLTFGIELMVRVFSGLGLRVDTAAKSAETALAVILFLGIGAVAGLLYSLLRHRPAFSDGGTVGLAWWVVTLVLYAIPRLDDIASLVMPALWFGIVFMFWGLALGRWFKAVADVPASGIPAFGDVNPERRQFLARSLGVIAVVTLGSVGLGYILNRGKLNASDAAALTPDLPSSGASGAAASAATLPATGPTATGTASAFVPAPGTRAELTPLDRFYRTDIDLGDVPEMDTTVWTLTLGGLVNTPFILNYDDLLKLPYVEQEATLECISNDLGGGLISETRWRGVKLADLLTKAGLKPGVVEIKFTCNDGYTESLPLASALDERTLVAYGMNGKPLTMVHGFPARLYVPNRYGMKSPKWMETIEAVGQPFGGYWEQRGWDKEAVVKTTAVIDTDTVDSQQNPTVPIGGIAFAGARGISRVEVSIDGGKWQEAVLKESLSPLTWRLWRFESHMSAGLHRVQVRATDGEGKLQTVDRRAPHPNGASGYHTKSITVV